jgi:hypothetical protein
MIRCSVLGISTGAAPDRDARLRDLLLTGIETAKRVPVGTGSPESGRLPSVLGR